MKEGAQHLPRRTVLAGLAALALTGTKVSSQERQEKSPERFVATIEPRTIERRTDRFRIQYQTPIVVHPENAGIAQHIDVFACVLQRDAGGAPRGTILKNIAFSRNAAGTFTLSSADFLAEHEQLVELSIRTEADHTEHTQLFSRQQLPFSISSEPPIPEGYSCSEKQVS
jgi:hypothetical protein